MNSGFLTNSPFHFCRVKIWLIHNNSFSWSSSSTHKLREREREREREHTVSIRLMDCKETNADDASTQWWPPTLANIQLWSETRISLFSTALQVEPKYLYCPCHYHDQTQLKCSSSSASIPIHIVNIKVLYFLRLENQLEPYDHT